MTEPSPPDPASEDRPVVTTHHRARSHRLLKMAMMGGSALLLILFVASIAAWQNEEGNHRGRVLANTTLAGEDVSGFDSVSLQARLESIATRYATAEIEIGHDEQRFSTSTSAIGLALDVPATKRAVLRFGHDENAIERYLRFLRGQFSEHRAPVRIALDEASLASVIAASDTSRTEAINPSIALENGRLVAREGKPGSGLSIAAAPDAIRQAATNGLPLRADVETGEIPPAFTIGDAQRVVTEATLATTEPIPVTAAGKTASLEPTSLRELVRATASGDRLVLDVDTDATTARLKALLPDAGTKPTDAGYEVVDDAPRKVEGKPGLTCCGDGAATMLRDALRARATNAPTLTLDLPLRSVEPAIEVADLPDLGIKEKIGTFTTHHPAGQPRVTNIHLIADLTRGSVIEPGATFSINNKVGERTTAKGFVVDHVIEDGKFTESVGGGISQYATTLFNAAFFGGLDFGEYQAHTIYIDRYPYGREATVSFPHPDLQVKNTTPYGVLIWPTYTNTSLTVSLYSTRYATGEQTNQTTAPSGKCTRVRTERTRTYTDGRKATDFVSALYQPKEGERC